jgi:hypothetical protein
MRNETKEERFVRIAAKRVQRVLDALASLSRCAAQASYSYTPQQVEQIFAELQSGILEAKKQFEGIKRFTLSGTAPEKQ